VDGGLKNNFSCRKANSIKNSFMAKNQIHVGIYECTLKNMLEVLAKEEDCSQIHWNSIYINGQKM